MTRGVRGMQISNHRLQDALQITSPNCDERPHDAAITLIVIHNIALPKGHFGGPYIQQLFTGELDVSLHPDFHDLDAVQVSSHLLVRRTGEILQFVPFDLRAWHAGESSFEGVPRCNDFSIGIELEGTDDTPYNSRQYSVLAHTCRALIDHYPTLTIERIVGHSDIAPGRKSDPGPAFDRERFARLLRET